MAAATASWSIAPSPSRWPKRSSARSPIPSGSSAWPRLRRPTSLRPTPGIASPNESFSPERKVAYMTHQADKNKVALITGITGQDGAYLADFLLQRGYTVHGIKRRASLLNTDRIDYLYHEGHDAGERLF